jgi:16S rRNA (cytosine967-C5)-methyltransferase
MHPKALMDACTDLVRQVLKFDHPADAVVSQFFKQQRKSLGLGPRERTALSGAVYGVLRQKLLFCFEFDQILVMLDQCPAKNLPYQ